MMCGSSHFGVPLSPRKRTFLIVLVALGLLAAPTLASAQSTDDAVSEEESVAETTAPAAVVTIPVLGSDLVVTISVDDDGTLSEVALDPADGFTLDAEQDHKMKFSSEDGSMVVKVKAKNDNIFTKVQAQDVESLTGPGTWTGDVFGTGDIATVRYVISVDAAGMPAVTVDDAIELALPDVAIDIKQGESDDEADEAESTAKVTFERDGYKVQLKITAEVQMQDGESRISLKIMLIGGGNSDDAADEDRDDGDDTADTGKSDKAEKKDKKPKKDKSNGKDDSEDDDSDTDVADGSDKDEKSDDHRKDD